MAMVAPGRTRKRKGCTVQRVSRSGSSKVKGSPARTSSASAGESPVSSWTSRRAWSSAEGGRAPASPDGARPGAFEVAADARPSAPIGADAAAAAEDEHLVMAVRAGAEEEAGDDVAFRARVKLLLSGQNGRAGEPGTVSARGASTVWTRLAEQGNALRHQCGPG